MFGFFKKKEEVVETVSTKTAEIHAVASGKLIPIEEVNDAVFSQKFMGDGFAVIPTDGTITSPFSGKVLSVFPTQHAVGIGLDNGLEVLLHMGIDTVQLEGKGFETLVKEGDVLTPDTVISKVDLDFLKEQGKDTPMIVVFTNMDVVANYELTATGDVQDKQTIGTITVK